MMDDHGYWIVNGFILFMILVFVQGDPIVEKRIVLYNIKTCQLAKYFLISII